MNKCFQTLRLITRNDIGEMTPINVTQQLGIGDCELQRQSIVPYTEANTIFLRGIIGFLVEPLTSVCDYVQYHTDLRANEVTCHCDVTSLLQSENISKQDEYRHLLVGINRVHHLFHWVISDSMIMTANESIDDWQLDRLKKLREKYFHSDSQCSEIVRHKRFNQKHRWFLEVSSEMKSQIDWNNLIFSALHQSKGSFSKQASAYEVKNVFQYFCTMSKSLFFLFDERKCTRAYANT